MEKMFAIHLPNFILDNQMILLYRNSMSGAEFCYVPVVKSGP